jgi:hypothetical protein
MKSLENFSAFHYHIHTLSDFPAGIRESAGVEEPFAGRARPIQENPAGKFGPRG